MLSVNKKYVEKFAETLRFKHDRAVN